jgi:hypothetical protein
MSQFNPTRYDIERPTGVCAVTGRALEPGEAYFATLIELPEGAAAAPQTGGTAAAAEALGFRRLDFSREAWEQGHRPERLFSYWKSTVPQPDEKKKKLFVDDAVLMNLLHRLGEAEQSQRLAFRYVLALILMRKRLLRYDGNVQREATIDGVSQMAHWWQFTPKLDVRRGPMSKWDEETTVEVLDPQLDESQIQDVTAQLGEILEAEL